MIFANLSNQINTLLSSALGQLAGTISLMFNAILYAIMIPLMVFFFLKDKKELLPIASFMLPKENGFMQSVFSEMNDQLFNYVTGKALEMKSLQLPHMLCLQFWAFLTQSLLQYLLDYP